jgi:hypothetical protein
MSSNVINRYATIAQALGFCLAAGEIKHAGTRVGTFDIETAGDRVFTTLWPASHPGQILLSQSVRLDDRTLIAEAAAEFELCLRAWLVEVDRLPEAEVVTDYGLQRWLGRAASVPLARERLKAPCCGDVAFRLGEGAGPRFRSRSAASTEIVRTARELVSKFDRTGAMALMRLAGSLPEATDPAIGYLARAAQSELHYRPRNMSLAWRVGSMTRVLLLGEASAVAHRMNLEGPMTAPQMALAG